MNFVSHVRCVGAPQDGFDSPRGYGYVVFHRTIKYLIFWLLLIMEYLLDAFY